MSLPHVGLAVLVMFLWGVNFVAAKLGLQELPPLLMLSIRFLLVGLLLIPFAPFPRGSMVRIALLSLVLGTIHFALMFNGIRGVDAGVAAIAVQLQVPFAAVLAAIIFKDKLGWRRLLGMAFAFAGISMLAGEPRMQSSLVSLGLVVAASFVWAIANIQVKLIRNVHPLSLLAWSSLMSAPQLFVLSLLMEHGQAAALAEAGWRGWGAIAYMMVCVSGIGYGIWYYLIPRYDVNQTMPFTLLVPMFGVASGALFLDERMTWLMLGGSVLTLIGVAVIILRRPRTAEGPLQT
jgi:O-acetylserine/cysteine efflux transporter